MYRYAEKGQLIMPTDPRKQRLPTRPVLPPKPMSVELEAVRERERGMLKKRKGFMSTMATRPSGYLGSLQIEKKKALGE